MVSFIIMLLCGFLLWLFSHFGIKNYEYDHAENMTVAKVVNIIIFLVLAILLFLKQF